MSPTIIQPDPEASRRKADAANRLAAALLAKGKHKPAYRAERLARFLRAGFTVDPMTARVNYFITSTPPHEYFDGRTSTAMRALARMRHLRKMSPPQYRFRMTRDEFKEYYRDDRREWNRQQGRLIEFEHPRKDRVRA